MKNPDTSDRQKYWLAHVKAAEASKGTQAEYARANGIKVKELYQWKTILIRRGLLPAPAEQPAFVGVAQTGDEPGCTIVLPNGVRIDIHGPLLTDQLQEIVTTASLLE